MAIFNVVSYFFQISKKTPRTFLFIEIQVTNYIFFGRHKMLSGWAIVSIKKKTFVRKLETVTTLKKCKV